MSGERGVTDRVLRGAFADPYTVGRIGGDAIVQDLVANGRLAADGNAMSAANCRILIRIRGCKLDYVAAGLAPPMVL